ncbi:flagellar protein FlgN [Sphingomonas suaedae]|uniref:Flagellar protein FlgN n=1 Tax=Sphingomonas suaedae TaxID=2599297 RepID=A0A518RIE2_9SPHN|nr:flagellar protein FlgN [Sphingomonas suaedae]QDX27190.1 flagellar protein FlgN [Sphingomonas suaedae]
MNRRDALVRVIDALHAEIDALKKNDVAALERATREKLIGIEAVGAANDDDPALAGELRVLAEEAHRLNESCRIYVNLMAANVRRRLHALTGNDLPSYRPGIAGAFS